MKILMLDIDGVLNYEGCKDRIGWYCGIEDEKVELLKHIVDATDAKIVLSSTWRLGYNNEGHRLEEAFIYLKEKLSKYGLSIYSMTPQIGRGNYRGREIHQWLQAYDGKVDEWVVLDDEWFCDFNQYEIGAHLVQTSFYGGGLTEEDAEEAIRILNGEYEDE